MSDQKVQVKREGPLPRLVHFVYFYQEFALGFMTTLGVQYFAFYMTDVALIPVAMVATIMLFGRIGDTFSVFVAGFMIQSVNFKKGKFSTWLYIATPLIIVFNLLMFSNLPIPLGAKAVLMGSSYILGFFFVNFCSTARFSILPTLTDDPEERTVLSARRGQGGSGGQIIRGMIYVPMVLWLGRVTGSPTWGYFFSALVFGGVAISGMYWLAYIARPYEMLTQAKEGPRPSIKDMLVQLGTNKPLLLIVVAETLRMSAANVNTTNNMYYFRYVGGNLMLMPIYLTITFFGSFLGATLVSFISKKVERKVTYFAGIIIYIIMILLAYFFAFGKPVVFMVVMSVAQFGAAIANAGNAAYFSDTADYGELKQGKNIRAINMGLVLIPIKLGVLIGGSIQAYRLAAIGFAPGTTDPAVIRGIHQTATLIPPFIMVLALIAMAIYPLNKKKVLEIQAELKARKAQQAQQA